MVVRETEESLSTGGRVAVVSVMSLRDRWRFRVEVFDERTFVVDDLLRGQYLDEVRRLREALVAHAPDGCLNMVDAGANVGLVPLFLEKTLPLRVRCVGFEPFHENRVLCERNWRGKPFFLRQEALADADRDAVALFVTSTTAATIIPREEGRPHPVRVAAVRLDTVWSQLALPRLDLLKLDIEGAEEEALAGAARTLAEQRPFILCSYEHASNDRKRIIELVRAAGPYAVRDRAEWRMLSFEPVSP